MQNCESSSTLAYVIYIYVSTSTHYPAIVIHFSGDSLALSVSSSEYIPYLLEYCLIKINAVIQVQETHQFWSAEDDFALQKPKLTVQSIDRQQLRSGRMGRIRLSFRNPLEVALTSCRITLGKSAKLLDCCSTQKLRTSVLACKVVRYEGKSEN